MKKLLITFLLSLGVITALPNYSFASSSGSSSGSVDTGPGVFGTISGIKNVITEVPGTLLPWMSQSEFRICQIRRFFCGRTATVIVAFSVFCMGMLILMQKVHWLLGIMFITGIIVFYDARQVAQLFGKQVFTVLFIDNPMCDCRCSINMDDLFNGNKDDLKYDKDSNSVENGSNGMPDIVDQLKACVSAVGVGLGTSNQ